MPVGDLELRHELGGLRRKFGMALRRRLACFAEHCEKWTIERAQEQSIQRSTRVRSAGLAPVSCGP